MLEFFFLSNFLLLAGKTLYKEIRGKNIHERLYQHFTFFFYDSSPSFNSKILFHKQLSIYLTVFLKMSKMANTKFSQILLNIENNEDGFAVCSGKNAKY